MAKLSWIALPVAILLVFGACGPSDGQEETQTNDDPEQVKQDVLADVWERVMQESEAEPKLPRDLETGDQYLTARVAANAEGYEVYYYLMDQPVPVDDPQLEDQAPYLIADAIVFDSAEGARAGVNYEPEMGTGQPADLGYGITGYMDAGAGNIHLVWHEGRWSFLVHQRNSEEAGDEMMQLARDIVEKLEQKRLPAPQEVGAGTFDMKGDGAAAHNLQWQAENVVYSVRSRDHLQLIDIVANMNE
ncbi:hypothetical protein SAMN04488127_1829 [Bhargavaea ginsengi]|uniref:DUF4367 domain-containing protein n=1 Tax=Bhargavaea ginsengi TaxID=426757 RepID=A0A1H6Z0T5_9BACL|nr:hypothetical protein [Bhargavaea ginsengi]SEJ44987.1 hypothetical protein SAMN04488127_1829 [Bhargavaea ginsengi]